MHSVLPESWEQCGRAWRECVGVHSWVLPRFTCAQISECTLLHPSPLTVRRQVVGFRTNFELVIGIDALPEDTPGGAQNGAKSGWQFFRFRSPSSLSSTPEHARVDQIWRGSPCATTPKPSGQTRCTKSPGPHDHGNMHRMSWHTRIRPYHRPQVRSVLRALPSWMDFERSLFPIIKS